MRKFQAVSMKYGPRLMRDLGITALDAAAILGNGGHESAGFTKLQEIKPTVKGSRGGYGWFQWTGPRRRAYEAFCKRNGLNPSDDAANYAYLLVELRGSEAVAIMKMRKAGNLHSKVVAFEMAFERAGVKHYDSRVRWANIALDVMQTHDGKVPVPADKPVMPKGVDKPMTTSKTNATAVTMAGGTTVLSLFTNLPPIVQFGIIAAVVAGAAFIIYERYGKVKAVREANAINDAK